EALDGGDSGAPATHRDRLLLLSAPFSASPQEVFRSAGRMSYPPSRATWGRNGLLVIEECDWNTHVRRLWRLDMNARHPQPRRLWEFNDEEAYAQPGDLVTALGSRSGGLSKQEAAVHDAILLQDGPWLYRRGEGLSRDGARPFLDRYNLET